MQYQLLSNVSNHLKMQNLVSLPLWPEFMLHDPVSNAHWSQLFTLLSDYQFSLMQNNEIIGIGNCIPFYWDQSLTDLPDTGWDWLLQQGIYDYQKGASINILGGLQIAVSAKHQGQGISSLIVREMITLARQNDFAYVVIPVRPSCKSQYPLIAMEHYVQWRREDGLPFDPWLRVHERLGGKILKVCHQAMHIPGTISQWEEWTRMSFLETGSYIIPGALNPIIMDLEKDLGEYVEPNVWVVHEVQNR